jgi:hypothetical protein
MTRILLLLLLLGSGAWAAEPPPALPATENHEFEWVATAKDGTKFSGHSFDKFIDGAFVYARRELNRLVKKDVVDAGTVFVIEIEWKGKKFKRELSAVAELEGEIPRGPNKKTELPRGPYRSVK